MDISGKTQLVCIIGNPIEHSLSPAIQNAAFLALRLNWCYLPFHLFPQDLKVSVELLRVIQNLKGANVTVPYKEKVIPFLDGLTTEAREIGAVNTIEVQADRTLVGHNTDGRGFVAAFREEIGMSLQGKVGLMVGAGGVARAVGYRLIKEQVREVIFINRTLSRAKGLAQQMRAWSPQVLSHGLAPDDLKIQDLLKRVDFLINATSLGLQASDPLPITLDGLNPNAVVCDLVYRPGGTFFSNLAKEKGWASMGGLPMLVHQGALAFEVWTGQKGPVQVMAEALQRV